MMLGDPALTGRNWYLYILKLEQDCWYVGTAKGLRSRLRSHAKKSPHATIRRRAGYEYSNRGLTGKRKPTHLHAAFRSVGDSLWITEVENAITFAMATRYGFDKVRGGGLLLHSWDEEVPDSTIQELTTRYGGIDIRSTYALVEVDLGSEKPYAFPLTKRLRNSR